MAGKQYKPDPLDATTLESLRAASRMDPKATLQAVLGVLAERNRTPGGLAGLMSVAVTTLGHAIYALGREHARAGGQDDRMRENQIANLVRDMEFMRTEVVQANRARDMSQKALDETVTYNEERLRKAQELAAKELEATKAELERAWAGQALFRDEANRWRERMTKGDLFD